MAVAVEQDGLVERVQDLTEQVAAIPDFGTRMLAEELAGSIVQLYGEGIERIFAALAHDGASAAEVREALVQDGVVASLMLIHGIYPVPLEERVIEALDSVRPYMESHGGNVQLEGIDENNVAHLRLEGHCKGCAASASTMELAIEKALEEFAPDLLGVEVQGVVEPAQGHAPPSLMPMDNALPMAIHQGAKALAGKGGGLPMAGHGAPEPAPPTHKWVELDGVGTLPRGSMTSANGSLLVANVAGTLLAYRDTCAGCGASLARAVLDGGTLACSECDRHFDLPRAGRCREEDGLQLQPVPLLRKNGSVQVAVLG